MEAHRPSPRLLRARKSRGYSFSASDDGARAGKRGGRKTGVNRKIHTAARNSHSPGR